LTPDGFPSFPLPTYSSIRCAVPNPREIARRIEHAGPDALGMWTRGVDTELFNPERAAALPVARKRCDHFRTLATLTWKVLATVRRLAPAVTAATARSRRSSE
jgi:hypothetical protein